MEKLNSEIYNSLFPTIEDSIAEIDDHGYPLTSGGVTYHWSVNGDVLSIVISNSLYPDRTPRDEYMVYNVSVSTGRRLSKNELLSAAGISQEEYHDTVWQALGSAYFQDYESFIAQQGYTDSFRMQLEETISEANIQACIPYFNEGGQLCIIGAKYSIAGASFYYQVINLENFVINEAFGEYMKAHTN